MPDRGGFTWSKEVAKPGPDHRSGGRLIRTVKETAVRIFILGVDAEGRSVVQSERTVGLETTTEPAVDTLWLARGSAGIPPPPSPKGSSLMDLGLGEGDIQWHLWRIPPNYSSAMHHTDTVDLQLVLEGQAKLLLGAGEIDLGPGDAVLLPGVEHQWVAGPAGCTFNAVIRGLGPRGLVNIAK